MIAKLENKPNRRARRIACAGEKGGGGKTTTSIHIAYELKSRGHKVAVIDNDPQMGFVTWNKNLPEYEQLTVIPIANVLRESDLSIFDDKCDFLVIDGAPGFDVDERLIQSNDYLRELSSRDDMPPLIKRDIINKLNSIFGSSVDVYARASQMVNLVDLIILPVKPSLQDIGPMRNYIDKVINPRMQFAKDVTYGIMASQHGGTEAQTYKVLMQSIKQNQYSSFDAGMKRRESYAKATFGSVVQLFDGRTRDDLAIKEIEHITNEIEEALL